ncbi:4-hydroxythreonine-4-phosphate dehydrogenase [Buchnera aphidicola (Neophyllaphis podocarpi)]|uniref:4-hydroxythreonine-4-phosphate dehydrogenase PdxA n=1 Tax=Buchnera aphidicola TaxID=9 RepID=UPI003464181E
MMNNKRIIITLGEPAGIGPDIIVMLSQRSWPLELVVCADPALLFFKAKKLGIKLNLIEYNSESIPIPQKNSTLNIIPVKMLGKFIPGKLCEYNSEYVINTIKEATNRCMNKEFSALVTGPVHKGIINKAGIKFTGHTDFLAKITKSYKTIMLIVHDDFKIAFATNHIPINKVSKYITYSYLYNTILIINKDLQNKFNILNPRILVCGLNPHAGEDGYLGNEELKVIIPVIKKLSSDGLRVLGPISADSVFQSKYLNNADVILVMYHDQGLPVVKYNNIGNSVNVTLGLPFIRTSVDHGTALNLINSNNNEIKVNSFVKAINLAFDMSCNII